MKYFRSAVYKTKKALTNSKSVLFAIFMSLVTFHLSLKNASARVTRPFFGGETGASVGQPDVATIKGIEAMFSNIVIVSLEFAGIVLFIILITAGFKFLTSQGDPKALEAARGTITHAIIGLVVLALAFVFIVLVKEITQVDITQFKVTK